MATLRLPGLLSGIDTGKLIQQLMVLQRRTLNVYQNRIETWEEKKDALGTLESKLRNLRASVQALSDSQLLRAFNTSTSDEDKLTAEATNDAFEGNHTIVINQLANSERWVHSTGLEYVEDYVGGGVAGTFIYSYNDEETSITTTATTTLQDLVGLINNDANNPGVTASLLYYNDAYHLVLNGNDAGTDYKISINSSNTEVLKSVNEFTVDTDNATLTTKINQLDQFSGTLDDDDVIQITGTDHYGNSITQASFSVTDNTRLEHVIGEIEDAFDGKVKATFENGKIVVTDKVSGSSSLTVVLAYDNGGDGSFTLSGLAISQSTQGGSTSADLTGFTQSDFVNSQAAQDSKIKVDGYPTAAAVAEVQLMSVTSGNLNNGDYRLTYNGQTTSVLDASADDEAAIQAAIDALSNVNPGDIVVYAVSGDPNDGFADSDIRFTFSDSLGDVSMIVLDDISLGPSPTIEITEETKGVDAYISRSSNTVDDVIYGITLHLHDTTDAAGEKITLTRDIQSVKDKLDSMIIAYNTAIEFIKEKTGYNDDLKTAGVLMGDYVVSIIRDQFRRPLATQTSGFVDDVDSFLSPINIGLELDRDGILSLDKNLFDEAIAEDYLGVLDVIGANKTGSSTSDIIEFYGASSNYTTAGTYDVQVVVSGSVITSARIKLSTESTYRDMTFSAGSNIVTGNSTFDDNGNPDYPENALQLSIDLSNDNTYTATINIKQGFTGAIEDAIDKMLKTTTGSIIIDKDHMDDQIELLENKIELEEYRIDKREERLIIRFARLERTLALLQHQMGALGMMSLPST